MMSENKEKTILRIADSDVAPGENKPEGDAPDEVADEVADEAPDEVVGEAPTATRNDLQLGRRLFHFLTGATIATLYALFLSHRHLVYFLGTVASLLYLLETVRISYPEIAQKLTWINRIFLRAEEQLKESASVPYAMGLLLTILTFPKVPALIAIYTLGVSDPLAAIIGINYGKRRIVKGKTLEGSSAFFLATTVCSMIVFQMVNSTAGVLTHVAASLVIGFFASVFETIPLRVDDNLTIPLYTAVLAWLTCLIFGINLF